MHSIQIAKIDWTAVGAVAAVATVFVYIVIAIYAGRQVREARILRENQSRPFVIAYIDPRSSMIILAFKNIGKTVAKNVRVKLNSRLESASERLGLKWQDSTLFAAGVPQLAPNERLRYFLDLFPQRKAKDLPMNVEGTITYDDFSGKTFSEAFIIDLETYGPALRADKDMVDLVDAVEGIAKKLP